MPRTKKALATLGIFILVLALYGIFLFIMRPEEAFPPSTPASLGLEMTSLTKLDPQGNKVWVLAAQKIHSTEDETSADQIKLNFFGDSQEKLRVQAEHLTLNPQTDDLSLTGKIVATSSEFTLQTENLRWESKAEKLWTDALVRVEHPEMTLTGTGFEYSPKTGIGTIRSDAHLIWKRTQTPKEPSK